MSIPRANDGGDIVSSKGAREENCGVFLKLLGKLPPDQN